MRFLVDAQLPPSLAQWIALQGHLAEHVALALAASARDKEIVVHAVASGAVIVTKDSDFLTLAPPRLLIVATGNVSNAELLALFQDRFPWVVERFAAGESVVEVP